MREAVGRHASSEVGRTTVRWLIIALAFVLGFRLVLYVLMPDFGTDFDLLYHAAEHLVRGVNPYPIATRWFLYPLFYPIPAVLLAVPFTLLRVDVARLIFDLMVGWVFAYALWRYRGAYALLAVLSGAYLFALKNGQTTPLMVGASLIPALGFLLAVKPNTALPLWLARPSRQAVYGGAAFLLLGFLVLPTWPQDWWLALQSDNRHLLPPVLRPFGFLLLLAALRWRTPEGRLLLAIAVIPQNTLPHELVSLALIPSTLLGMAIYAVGTWIAVGYAAVGMHHATSIAQWTAMSWPSALVAVHLPMLYLVLRQQPRRGEVAWRWC
jgi:hypothetical protein